MEICSCRRNSPFCDADPKEINVSANNLPSLAVSDADVKILLKLRVSTNCDSFLPRIDWLSVSRAASLWHRRARSATWPFARLESISTCGAVRSLLQVTYSCSRLPQNCHHRRVFFSKPAGVLDMRTASSAWRVATFCGNPMSSAKETSKSVVQHYFIVWRFIRHPMLVGNMTLLLVGA